MIEALAFYMFAAITVASGVLVISMRNPVHSVLFLIQQACSYFWARNSWR
jgi:NADH-quinone oxidoreductase subunit J